MSGRNFTDLADYLDGLAADILGNFADSRDNGFKPNQASIRDAIDLFTAAEHLRRRDKDQIRSA
ncbi:hypothetical protein FHS96_005562 [Sphingomonas zeicaulis]|uniref:hypothetical protein n=1 Tax=Sphingomonas zeicaulis TaxID=1632740 RepID=UPI003D1B164D